MVELDFATVDFETYYSKEFSLSKMMTDEYILDPRFQIIGVSARPSKHEQAQWFASPREDEVRDFLAETIDWENTPVCAHHAHFDGFIATQRLGLEPLLWLDSLSMARVVYPRRKSYSLAALAKDLLGDAKGTEVVAAMGKRFEDFSPYELARYGDYCLHDTNLCCLLADMFMSDKITPLEARLIDMTVRMFTEPVFEGDVPLLEAYHASEVARKEKLMLATSADKDTIMSNPKMAQALEELGVRPPRKVSPRTGKETFAFAKTDKAFKALLEHPNEDVQALVAARLGVKSTIAETRAVRFIEMANRGPMPMYLQHAGAKTTLRHSGGNKVNVQNIPARGPASALRDALCAPPGYKVVVGDSSNIELRFAMAGAGEREAVEKLYDGVDMYCDFASDMYGRTIIRDDKNERMMGKVATLSCQYGTGAATFQEMARGFGLNLSLTECEDIVHLYRKKYRKVREWWYYCGDVVLKAIERQQLLVAVDRAGWMATDGEGFSVPGHPGVVYKDLRMGQDGNYEYWSGRAWVKIYSGKVVENGCQYGSRNIVMWQAARLHRYFPVKLMVHDEMVCVVPEEEAEDCREYMLECLRLAPPWCRGAIPLDGEAAIGNTYGDAK